MHRAVRKTRPARARPMPSPCPVRQTLMPAAGAGALDDRRLLQFAVQGCRAGPAPVGVNVRRDDIHQVVGRVGERRAGEAVARKHGDRRRCVALVHDSPALRGWRGRQRACLDHHEAAPCACAGASGALLKGKAGTASSERLAGSAAQRACRRKSLWNKEKILALGW